MDWGGCHSVTSRAVISTICALGGNIQYCLPPCQSGSHSSPSPGGGDAKGKVSSPMAFHTLRRLAPLGLVLFIVGSVGSGCSSSGSGPKPAGKGLGGVYDVRAFGATGDGTTLDTAAVNNAIAAANADGG